MHAVLRIHEILSRIFAVVHRRSLLSVGLTCKAFHEPAMDALWYTIDSIVPLLMCIPADALGPDARGVARWKHCITRELTRADWVRFEAAARRVREYVVADGLDFGVDFDFTHPVFAMIVDHFAGLPILPNLKRFENRCIKARGDHVLILRPPVRAVDINHSVSLAHRNAVYQELISTTLELIRTTESVQRVILGDGMPITKEVFLFAAMPRLSHLSFTVDDRIPLRWAQDFATLPADSFPMLRTLGLSCKSLAPFYKNVDQALNAVDVFLKHAKPRMRFSGLIVSFTFPQNDDEYSGTIHRLCRTIATHCPALDCLEVVTLYTYVAHSALIPLYNIHSLRVLRLAQLSVRPWIPEAVQRMGEAWPHLAELRVNSHGSNPAPLSVLRHILDAFPNLTALAMSVAPDPDTDRELQRPGTPVRRAPRALETLYLGNTLWAVCRDTHLDEFRPSEPRSSAEQDAERLARTLAELCPAADITWLVPPVEDASVTAWTRLMKGVVQRRREIVECAGQV